jgi:hypothetical protein
MTIQYIQPGKPNQYAYIGRFNRTYREELRVVSLDDVRTRGHLVVDARVQLRNVPTMSLVTRHPRKHIEQPETLLSNGRVERETYATKCAFVVNQYVYELVYPGG